MLFDIKNLLVFKNGNHTINELSKSRKIKESRKVHIFMKKVICKVIQGTL